MTPPHDTGDTFASAAERATAVKLFTEHPHAVGETYGKHLRVATGFGFTMIVGGLASVIHGLCPWMFQTTGSRTIKKLYNRLTGRGAAEAGYGDWEGAGV